MVILLWFSCGGIIFLNSLWGNFIKTGLIFRTLGQLDLCDWYMTLVFCRFLLILVYPCYFFLLVVKVLNWLMGRAVALGVFIDIRVGSYELVLSHLRMWVTFIVVWCWVWKRLQSLKN